MRIGTCSNCGLKNTPLGIDDRCNHPQCTLQNLRECDIE